MQWDEKELDSQLTPSVYFWTPNFEILAKALVKSRVNPLCSIDMKAFIDKE